MEKIRTHHTGLLYEDVWSSIFQYLKPIDVCTLEKCNKALREWSIKNNKMYKMGPIFYDNTLKIESNNYNDYYFNSYIRQHFKYNHTNAKFKYKNISSLSFYIDSDVGNVLLRSNLLQSKLFNTIQSIAISNDSNKSLQFDDKIIKFMNEIVNYNYSNNLLTFCSCIPLLPLQFKILINNNKNTLSHLMLTKLSLNNEILSIISGLKSLQSLQVSDVLFDEKINKEKIFYHLNGLHNLKSIKIVITGNNPTLFRWALGSYKICSLGLKSCSNIILTINHLVI